jgi:hypothetical protein
MKENTLALKCIYDLLDLNFVIPDYQRGYRWTKSQVNDLLDDIWEFHQTDEKKKEEFYCLQPVVVVPLEDGSYSVVDGQQRLTTISIIMEALKEARASLGYDKIFNISYATRPGSEAFLKNIDLDLRNKNIDYFHFCNAYEKVQEWFNQKAPGVKGKFLSTLLGSDEEGKNVKVLWYEVNETNVDPRTIFTRINKGKIPLNNAELIKALFLNKSNFTKITDDAIHLRQLEIASEWDQIEFTLRDLNNQFWDFITDGKTEYDNRIEFVFDIISGKPANADKDYTFRYFVSRFQENNNNIEVVWREIKDHFLLLQGWYENHKLYHLIGFLIATGTNVGELVKKANKLPKSTFLSDLNDKINKGVKCDITTLNYQEDAKKIKDVLLLFNILVVLSYEDENYKFQFGKFKREKGGWDLEHIHSVQSVMPSDTGHQRDWLKEVQRYTEDKELKQRIDDYLSKEDSENKEDFNRLFEDILKKYSFDQKPEDINDISNMALLDAGTNRGYKNSIFPIKRRTIIDKEKAGAFIPPGTRNVFLKFYNDNVEQMSFWGPDDRQAYLENLKTILSEYIEESKATVE